MTGAGRALVDGYDLVIFDLDGVVYLGDQAVPGAVEALAALRAGGVPVEFVTNNASRRAGEVAALLRSLGVQADDGEVLTSAQGAAALLAERLPAGAPVLVVGADALVEEVAAAGLTPVSAADDGPVAVVQGYGPQVGWAQLAEATIAVRAGATWIATNTDRTLPTPRGNLPGNGALVAAVATALDRTPDTVVGKPEPALFVQAARRRGAQRPLVVGDRLDTDIAGANRAGMASVLVLTGVSTPADTLVAPRGNRPDVIVDRLGALLAVPDGNPDGWSVRRQGPNLVLDGRGEPVTALRALCEVAWAVEPAAAVEPASAEAKAALLALGL